MIRYASFICLAISMASVVVCEEVIIDFENVPIQLDPNSDELVNRVESYESQGAEFKLARAPERSKAKGRVMFVAHVATGRKGILNAMVNEQQIPVQIRFSKGATKVTIVFWASTGAAAELEAFNSHGELVAHDELEESPKRKQPEDPVPMFELSVEAEMISYVEFSGPRDGEFLVADELRFEPLN